MSLKLQEEYGEDLQVIFVEVQGTDDPKVASFALEKKWLGGRAMWTTERPFDVGLDGIPQFGLLSPQGEVVLTGYTNQMTSKIDDAIAEMVKSARKPQKDLPKEVAKALVEAAAGGYGKALAALDAVLADPKAEAEHAAAREARTKVDSQVDRALGRVTWLLDNGYPLEAQAVHGSLSKALADVPARAEAVSALTKRLATEEVKAELAAAKALARAEEKLYKDGPGAKAKRTLEKIAESHAGTKVAARAQELARIAG